MIDTPAERPMAATERIKPDGPPYWEVVRCARCRNPLNRVYLTAGSWISIRCHHTIKRPDGTRGTCGYETTIRPPTR